MLIPNICQFGIDASFICMGEKNIPRQLVFVNIYLITLQFFCSWEGKAVNNEKKMPVCLQAVMSPPGSGCRWSFFISCS
jgi:hypothetical protein